MSLLTTLFCCPATGAASPVDAARITAADAEPGNWLSHGRTYDEQRYTPLTQITLDNVDRLSLAWSYEIGSRRGIETTPLVIDGVLYGTGSWSIVYALDAKSGRELWRFDPKVPKWKGRNACCDVVNRGVAAWQGKIYVGTIDGRLIALDAATGVVVWDVQTTDPKKPYTITGAPRVVGGRVMIGNGGADLGVRGYFSAYDAETGDLAWRFYTVPGSSEGPHKSPALERAAKTWSKQSMWESGGGGTVWDSFAYDPELDLLYAGVGNGSIYDRALRSPGGGDNLYLASILALRPATGELVWHYQTTPGETWDYTAVQQMILADIELGGRVRQVLMQAPKNGFFYVLDRATGELLSAEKFATVSWATHVDMESGRPVERAAADWSNKPAFVMPGPPGAHNWHPMSYNPATGLVYIPAQQIPQGYIQDMDELDRRKVLGFNIGASLTAAMLPDDKAAFRAAVAATTGRLVAFDPRTGKVAWGVDYPAAWNGGTMTTAGNLVFQGTSTGRFRAYAADTGKQLLDLDMQSGIVSAPSTFRVGGVQYVAFQTSKGGAFPLVAGVAGGVTRKVPNIPRLVVLKLGGTVQLPAPPATTTLAWNPPAQFGTPQQIASGKAHFGRYCQVCHGDSAIGNGFTPDLRVSGALTSADAWKGVILDGALKDRGMVSFAKVLSPADVEAIRAYVIDRSNWTKANLPEASAPVGR